MKKITILVDDDVEMIDIFPARDEKVILNYKKEGYINQKVLGVNVYKGKNKPAFIEATYFAIPTDDKVEKPNQKAIECLKELEHYMLYEYAGHYSFDAGMCQWIDNKIKELEEER